MNNFYMLHNDLYYSAIPGLTGEIKRVNTRIMYVEEDQTAVIHVGVQYDSAPKEEEYLIAVSIGQETQSTCVLLHKKRAAGKTAALLPCKKKTPQILHFEEFLAQREGFEPSCSCLQTDFESFILWTLADFYRCFQVALYSLKPA